MIAEYFVDTNILLYAGSNASADADKRRVARQLLLQPGIGFSAQVMQEFYDAAVRKQRLGITHEEAVVILEALQPYPVLPVTRELVLEATQIRHTFSICYWDAAIVAAARQLGCRVIYTEDLNAGQVYSGVQVVNPFENGVPAER
jgi:predicted nucleic acid-binding protein